MKKIIFIMIIALAVSLIVFSSSAITALAAEGLAAPSNARVVDNANILSEKEEASLNQKISGVVAERRYDILVLTENKYIGSLYDYCSDYFDDNSYGYLREGNATRMGTIFLINMYGVAGDRDFYVFKDDGGVNIITNYGIDVLTEELTSPLSDGDYCGACELYVDIIDDFVKEADGGKPFDLDNKYMTKTDKLIMYAAIVGGSFVISLIIVIVMRSRLNTAKFQPRANEYVKQNSFKLTRDVDKYLYCTITKVPIPKPSSSSGGGRSSGGGGSRGGGGGKF